MTQAKESHTEEAFFESRPRPEPPAGFESDVARAARRPSGWRSPTLTAVVVLFSAYAMWWLWPDVRYFFSDPEPISLEQDGIIDLLHAEHDTYTRIAGLPSILKAQYTQLGRKYKVFYLVGTRVFVREPLEPVEGASPTDDYPTFDGSGRLLAFDQATEFRNVQGLYEQKSGFDFSKGAWILLSGVEPRQQWWWPVGFAALGVIALWNLLQLGRRVLGR